jgi:hypothetical protein
VHGTPDVTDKFVVISRSIHDDLELGEHIAHPLFHLGDRVTYDVHVPRRVVRGSPRANGVANADPQYGLDYARHGGQLANLGHRSHSPASWKR